MKNLKKVLSLILVVAMACSMMVFASAKDYKSFPDADKISDQYTEAVDVIAALGIFAGDDEGYLNPQGTFTRAQAAKIVTYLSIGATAAERLSATGGVFKDVPATHWASKYIAYAYNAGILSGDGDGNYRPNDAVKGSEVAKMMNTVLGYGKTGEYSGASWELNAISHGVSRGLITGSADLTAPAKREEVIQYVFNTIDPRGLYNYYVEYSSIIGSYVKADGTGGTWTAGTANKTNIGSYVFSLSYDVADDANGRPIHTWKVLASYITEPYAHATPAYTSKGGSNIYTTADAIKAYDLESAHKLTFAANFEIFRNGREYYAAGTTRATTDAEAKLADANTAAIKLGTLTEIYLDANGHVNRIVIIEKTVAEVLAAPSYAYGAVSSIAGITNVPVAGASYAGDLNVVKGDIVLYYYDADNVVHIQLAKNVEGQLTSFTDNIYAPAFVAFVFGGTTYAISGLNGVSTVDNDLFTRVSIQNKNNYNVDSVIYLDDFNNIVKFKPNASVTNYVYVVKTGLDAFLEVSQARMVGIDGTYFTASVTQSAASKVIYTLIGTSADCGWYSYTESNGVYSLTRVKAQNATDYNTYKLISSPSFLTTSLGANEDLGAYADGNTVFVIWNTATGATKVVTGVANLPSTTTFTTATSITWIKTNATSSYAKYVFISTGDTVAGAANVAFFSNVQLGTTGYTVTGVDYVTFKYVVINGELKTDVKVDINNMPTAVGLYTVTVSNDIYSVGPATGTSGTNALLSDGENTLQINSGAPISVSSTSVVFDVTTGVPNASALANIEQLISTNPTNYQMYNYWYRMNTANTAIIELYVSKSTTTNALANANITAAVTTIGTAVTDTTLTTNIGTIAITAADNGAARLATINTAVGTKLTTYLQNLADAATAVGATTVMVMNTTTEAAAAAFTTGNITLTYFVSVAATNGTTQTIATYTLTVDATVS